MFYLFLSGVISTFGFAAVQLYFVVYAVEELSIDKAVWPLILTALFITMIILAVPMGKIIDKVNRKLPLLGAYVMCTAFCFSCVGGGCASYDELSLQRFASGFNPEGTTGKGKRIHKLYK